MHTCKAELEIAGSKYKAYLRKSLQLKTAGFNFWAFSKRKLIKVYRLTKPISFLIGHSTMAFRHWIISRENEHALLIILFIIDYMKEP